MEVKEGKVIKDSFDEILTDNQNTQLSNRINNYYTIANCMVFCLAIVIIILILVNQYGPKSQDYRDMAYDSSVRTENIEPRRGNILSDDGRILASSSSYYDIRFDPLADGLVNPIITSKIKGFKDSLNNVWLPDLAKAVSDVFGDRTSQQYLSLFLKQYKADNPERNIKLGDRTATTTEYNYLKSKSKLMRRSANNGGVKVTELHHRRYPNGSLAHKTIGYINTNHNLAGLELVFDDQLKGRMGLTLTQKVTKNFWVPIYNDYNIEPENGYDIVSTINIELQEYAQKELVAQLKELNADWGTVIILDTKTGDVKAIANASKDRSGNIEAERLDTVNFALEQGIEPGSTFKTPVFLTLVNDKHVPVTKSYNLHGGECTILDCKIRDSHAPNQSSYTLQEILEHSSNVGITQATWEYYSKEQQRFLDSLLSYGFLQKLNLQAPKEFVPFYYKPGSSGWRLPMISYGYTVLVAPIHMATFYNAIANNGKMVKPRFVSKVMSKDETVKEYPVEVINPRICSKDALEKVQTALEGVVLRGTGKLYLGTCNYRIAAKTGTAQVAMGKYGYTDPYGGKSYFGSLSGYFPIEDPKYTIYVGMKTYNGPHDRRIYYGASLCGNLFRHIADYVYENDVSLKGNKQGYNSAPDKVELQMQNGNDTALTNIIDDIGVHEAMSNIRKPEVVSDSLNNNRSFVGYSLADAMYELHKQGYKVIVVGQGNIYNQIYNGNEVTLYLK